MKCFNLGMSWYTASCFTQDLIPITCEVFWNKNAFKIEPVI